MVPWKIRVGKMATSCRILGAEWAKTRIGVLQVEIHNKAVCLIFCFGVGQRGCVYGTNASRREDASRRAEVAIGYS